METKLRLIAGVALLLFGALMVANVFPLATIIYPEKFWYSLYPDGTSSNPTMLTPGSSIQLKAQLVYFDAETGTTLPGTYLTWIVQVSIPELGQTVTLDDVRDVVSSVESRYSTFVFQEAWTVPSEEGKALTFNWLAIVRDENYNEIGRQELTTYAKTIADEPDGYFTINGENADQMTTQVVLNPTLQLGFTATKNGDKITDVYVEVWKETTKVTTVTLSSSGLTWTGSYTLPTPGTYQLKGFYSWTGSTQPIQKMTVVMNWGTSDGDGDGVGGWFSSIGINQLAGFGSIIAGAVLLFKRDER